MLNENENFRVETESSPGFLWCKFVNSILKIVTNKYTIVVWRANIFVVLKYPYLLKLKQFLYYTKIIYQFYKKMKISN